MSEERGRAERAERDPEDDGNCIGCGPDNDVGLRLRFSRVSETTVRGETTLPERFCGWAGFAHGGTVCMLLDEAMAWACANAGRSGVTANLNVRFRRPTPLDATLVLTGTIMERRGRVIRLRAELRDAAERLLATAEGDFVDRGELNSSRLRERLLA